MAQKRVFGKSAPVFQGVKAVLFDIDDTLFPSTAFAAQARRNAIAAMVQAGLRATPAQAQAELARIVEQQGSNFGRHFDLLTRRFPCKNRPRAIAAGVAAYHATKSAIRPLPSARATLLSLRRRGFVVAAASEGRVVKQWDKLIRLGLDNLFDEVFVTFSPGKAGLSASGPPATPRLSQGKSPAFYRRIARALHLPPSAILMAGDHPQKDIAAAQAAGLRTVRLREGYRAQFPSNAERTITRLGQLPKLLPAKAK